MHYCLVSSLLGGSRAGWQSCCLHTPPPPPPAPLCIACLKTQCCRTDNVAHDSMSALQDGGGSGKGASGGCSCQAGGGLAAGPAGGVRCCSQEQQSCLRAAVLCCQDQQRACQHLPVWLCFGSSAQWQVSSVAGPPQGAAQRQLLGASRSLCQPCQCEGHFPHCCIPTAWHDDCSQCCLREVICCHAQSLCVRLYSHSTCRAQSPCARRDSSEPVPGIIGKSAWQGEAPTYSKIVSVGSGGFPPTMRESSSSPIPTGANGPMQHQAHPEAAGSLRTNGPEPQEHCLQTRQSAEESSSDVSSCEVSSGNEGISLKACSAGLPGSQPHQVQWTPLECL